VCAQGRFRNHCRSAVHLQKFQDSSVPKCAGAIASSETALDLLGFRLHKNHNTTLYEVREKLSARIGCDLWDSLDSIC